MEDHNLLLESLLSSNTASSPLVSFSPKTPKHDKELDQNSNPSIIFRFLSLILIGIISMWANYEASKGFDITLLNDGEDSLSGKRFDLFYVSNDKATRIVQNTSSFVENVLYSPSNTEKKQVSHVTLRLANSNVSNMVDVSTVNTESHDEFVISISALVITNYKGRELDEAISSLVLRGMARIWLWNGESKAPLWLVDAMIEYIAGLAGFVDIGNNNGSCEFDRLLTGHNYEDPKRLARYFDYCERHDKGFIRRLNRVLKERWDDRRVENMFETCHSIGTRSKGKVEECKYGQMEPITTEFGIKVRSLTHKMNRA